MSAATAPTWSACYKLVKESRVLQQQATKRLPHDFVFTEKGGNTMRMYFLAEVPGRTDDTIYWCDVPQSSLPTLVDNNIQTLSGVLRNIEAYRLIEAKDAKLLLGQPTREEQLLRERQRIVAYGITSYEHDPTSGRLVFPAAGQLYSIMDSRLPGEYMSSDGPSISSPVLPEEVPLPRGDHVAGSAAMCPCICPADANFVAFVLNKNVYLASRHNNTVHQLTFENVACDRSAGAPSYIIQEEFDRYVGMWWNPCKRGDSVYLLYEVVDESTVELVNLPSHSADFVPRSEPFRFARAGTPNAVSEIRLCQISGDIDSVTANAARHDNGCAQQHQHFGIRHFKLVRPLREIYPEFEYLIRAGWANENFAYVVVMNRLQTEMKVLLLPVEFFVPFDEQFTNGHSSYPTCNAITIYSETSAYWLKSCDAFKFLSVDPFGEPARGQYNAKFIWASEQFTGFNHLYFNEVIFDKIGNIWSTSECDISDGQSCLSDFQLCVSPPMPIVPADSNSRRHRIVCFCATGPSPLESHLFAAGIDDNASSSGQAVLTTRCYRLTQPGYYHSVEVAGNCSLFIDRFSNLEEQLQLVLSAIVVQPSESSPVIVAQPIARIVLNSPQPSPVAPIMHNHQSCDYQHSNNATPTRISSGGTTALQQQQSPSQLTVNSTIIRNPDSVAVLRPPKLFSFTSQISGHTVYGLVFPPPEHLEKSKRPTMLYVYGGPGIQLVNLEYKTGRYFRLALAAYYGIPAVIVDCRGSARRGRVWENHIAQQMGQVEVAEHVEGLDEAAERFPFIDRERVAIHGWSYGGYLSLMALAQRPDRFKLAISGAPATDWRLYDTAWTERYMGLPPNAGSPTMSAYHIGSVLSLAHRFPDDPDRLWIVHGLLDENVHFAHTAALLDALNRAGKPYRLYAYPNELHGLRQPENYAHCCALLLYALLNHL